MPILGALLVVVGAWLSKYHPAAWLLAVTPILIWLGIHIAAFARRKKDRP